MSNKINGYLSVRGRARGGGANWAAPIGRRWRGGRGPGRRAARRNRRRRRRRRRCGSRSRRRRLQNQDNHPFQVHPHRNFTTKRRTKRRKPTHHAGRSKLKKKTCRDRVVVSATDASKMADAKRGRQQRRVRRPSKRNVATDTTRGTKRSTKRREKNTASNKKKSPTGAHLHGPQPPPPPTPACRGRRRRR